MIALALVVVGLAFAYGFHTIGVAVVRALGLRWDQRLTLEARRVAVEERRMALDEAARQPRAKAQPMPPDLRHRIASFEDEWAREDEERNLFSLYAETDDWEAVRKQLKPLVSDMGEQVFAEQPEFVR